MAKAEIKFNVFSFVDNFLLILILSPFLPTESSKVGNLSQGRPEGSLFNRYYTEV